MDYRGVYRSSDNGATWLPANNGLTVFALYVNCLTTKGSDVFAGTGDGVYRTTNNGTKWTVASPVTANGGRPEINTIVSLGSYVFAGTPVNGIFRSADNGATWTAVDNGIIAYAPVYSIITRGADLIAGTSSGVFISTDNGNTWIKKSNGLQSGAVRTVAAKGDTLVAAIYDAGNLVAVGISISVNNGENWSDFDKNIKPFAVHCVAINDNNVYAATETESIWKGLLSAAINAKSSASNLTANSTNKFNSIQDKIIKLTLAPNPAKNNLTISFYSPKQTQYQIIIYDLQGKAVLNKEGTASSGINSINIDVTHFMNGTYILKLNNNLNESMIQKFIKQ